VKDTIKRMKRQRTRLEKIFSKDTPYKGFVSKIYKNSTRKQTTQFENGQKV
jgi:hypothetical protein